MNNKRYNEVDWDKYLYYDETSPSCLRWKVHRSNNAKVDSVAGCFDKYSKQYRITFNKKNYVCSRIIWVLLKGCISNEMVIDHMDGNPRNNKIVNLREVTIKTNNQNKSIDARNSSGKTGVILVNIHGYYSWCSAWVCSKTNRVLSKYFSVLKYGEEKAFELACNFRDNKLSEQISLGEEYTERHGT